MNKEYSWSGQFRNSFNNNIQFERFKDEDIARSFADMVNGKVIYDDCSLFGKAV